MFQGPLCAEPVEGMAYFAEALEMDQAQLEGENGELSFSLDWQILCWFWELTEFCWGGCAANVKLAQVGGSLISASKEACRSGLLDWSPRLKMAIYSCDIQASSMSPSLFFSPA